MTAVVLAGVYVAVTAAGSVAILSYVARERLPRQAAVAALLSPLWPLAAVALTVRLLRARRARRGGR